MELPDAPLHAADYSPQNPDNGAKQELLRMSERGCSAHSGFRAGLCAFRMQLDLPDDDNGALLHTPKCMPPAFALSLNLCTPFLAKVWC